MAVIPVVYKGLQIGLQSGLLGDTAGVAANKRLLSLGVSRLQPRADGGKMHTGQGNKLATGGHAPGKQWSEFGFEGLMTFNESVYILASGVVNPTVGTDGTNGKLWDFLYNLNAPDVKKYYTVEQGNSVRAYKAVDAGVNSFEIQMSKGDAMLRGGFIGGLRQKGVTITASPQEINPKYLKPGNWDVYVGDSLAALDTAESGGDKFVLPIKANLQVGDIAGTLFRMNSADPHFHARPEKQLAPKLTFTGGDDTGDYDEFADALDSFTTKWFRFLNLGDVIAGAVASQERLQIDFCAKAIAPETPEEEEGAALNTWAFENIYDPVAGFSLRIRAINTLAAL